MITIVNLRKEKPVHRWDVVVDRRSVLGNPTILTNESQRDAVCNEYEVWLANRIAEKNEQVGMEIRRLRRLHWSFGRVRLFCWCAPKRCHAETIKRVLLRRDKK